MSSYERSISGAFCSIPLDQPHSPLAPAIKSLCDHLAHPLLIDCLAVRLLGRRLSSRSNDTALAVMAAAKGDANRRVGLAITVLGQVPEAHMH